MFVQSVFDGCVLFQTVQSVFYNVCQCLFIQCLTMSVFDGCLTMIVQLVFVNVVSCVFSSTQFSQCLMDVCQCGFLYVLPDSV